MTQSALKSKELYVLALYTGQLILMKVPRPKCSLRKVLAGAREEEDGRESFPSPKTHFQGAKS